MFIRTQYEFQNIQLQRKLTEIAKLIFIAMSIV